LEHIGFSISYEAIYQYIYHPKTADLEELIVSLRRCHRKRMHKSTGRKVRKPKIPNRVPIDVRPKSVETRRYYGHWEGDSLISRKSPIALNSLTEIGLKCYFAHPYASWQQGTNKHINGLVRWYLPKGTDFSRISEEQIAQIESLINNRPRKCPGLKTPVEVASSCVALRD
jgi:IS30 family transposase